MHKTLYRTKILISLLILTGCISTPVSKPKESIIEVHVQPKYNIEIEPNSGEVCQIANMYTFYTMTPTLKNRPNGYIICMTKPVYLNTVLTKKVIKSESKIDCNFGFNILRPAHCQQWNTLVKILD